MMTRGPENLCRSGQQLAKRPPVSAEAGGEQPPPLVPCLH